MQKEIAAIIDTARSLSLEFEQLFHLLQCDLQQAIHIYGPSGSGKSATVLLLKAYFGQVDITTGEHPDTGKMNFNARRLLPLHLHQRVYEYLEVGSLRGGGDHCI